MASRKSLTIFVTDIHALIFTPRNMTQQQIVEEVVMRGLRPKFPAGTPRGYAELAHACWAGSAANRPSFEEVGATGVEGQKVIIVHFY